jgi:Tol biopolymer transport system component
VTEKQWQSAWILSERAGDLDGDSQSEFLKDATADAEVERELCALFDELRGEPNYAPVAGHQTGDVIGRYVLNRRIGSGGMGEVYSAEDQELRRSVAVKFLAEAIAEDDAVMAQIITEARLASQLNHPNIVTVHELIDTPWGLAIVMELVEGQPLRQLLKSRVQIPEAIHIGRQLASALAAARERGIVHRDIKPENVMVRNDGFVKVLDFGLAQRACARTPGNNGPALPAGTFRYMAPEQRRGDSATAASDIFAAGLVLYEMLAGSHPFPAASSADTSYAMTYAEPKPLRQLNSEVPEDLANLVRDMLAKRPDQRPASASVASALLRQEARLASPGRRPYFAALLAVVLVICMAGLTFVIRKNELAREAEPDLKLSLLTGLRGMEQRPAFSPDGNRVAFEFSSQQSPIAHIYVEDLLSGKLARITEDSFPDFYPAFSPDGAKLAFLRRGRNGALRLMIMPSGGGGPRQVGEIAGDLALSFRLFTWDGSGANIIVCDEDDATKKPVALFIISVNTGARTQITFPKPDEIDRMPALSPDHRWLGFARVERAYGTGRLLALRLEHGVPSTHPENPQPIANITEQMWAWDWEQHGRELLVAFMKNSVASLFSVPLPNGSPARVRAITDQVRELAVSRKGNRLIYSPGVARQSSIWEYPLTSNKAPTLIINSATFDFDPRFSPDGQQIAFASLRSGTGADIWVCRRDGSDARKISLFPGDHSAGSPNWSPDGKWIAFDAGFPKMHNGIFVSDILGGEPKRLTSPLSNDALPSWSQDGRWIYYASDRDGSRNIWRVSVAGGAAQQVTHHGGFECFEAASENALYFTKGDRDGGIWRISLTGGEESKVRGLENVSNRYWQGSPKGIYFVEGGKPTLLKEGIYFATPEKPAFLKFFSFSTGRSVVLRKTPPPQPIYRCLSVSPDGRSALFMQNEWGRANLTVVSNFQP